MNQVLLQPSYSLSVIMSCQRISTACRWKEAFLISAHICNDWTHLSRELRWIAADRSDIVLHKVEMGSKTFLSKWCSLHCLQSGTETWLLFSSCCIFSLHNQLEGNGPRRLVSVRLQIILWNFTRYCMLRQHNLIPNIVVPATVENYSYMENIFWVFQSCQSLKDHLMTIEGNPQPYLLATGIQKHRSSASTLCWTESFFNVSLVQPWAHLMSRSSPTFFSIWNMMMLSSLYTFLQTTLYNIDIGTTEETLKVKELRARLLNKQ